MRVEVTGSNPRERLDAITLNRGTGSGRRRAITYGKGGPQANKCAGSELFRKADHAAKRGAGEELEREGGGGREEDSV